MLRIEEDGVVVYETEKAVVRMHCYGMSREALTEKVHAAAVDMLKAMQRKGLV